MELDDKLFENFLEEKSNPVVGALEQNMYAGRFDWNDCLQSIGVRRYLKDAIMGMIEVHAEVRSHSQNFTGGWRFSHTSGGGEAPRFHQTFEGGGFLYFAKY